LLASLVSSSTYGGAFRERHGENVTHSRHHFEGLRIEKCALQGRREVNI